MTNKLFIKERLTNSLMELDEKKIVGGVLIKCIKTNNVFLLLRNDKSPSWALVSGGIDKGEPVLDGLKREVHEELFINPNDIEFKFIGVEQVPNKNMEFHYFEGLTTSEFKPILDHENLNYGWFSKDKLPSPLFKGLDEKIAKI
jgi:8-oxo-dGTP pyrophosphatase MutT (NUDIX family)